MSAIELGSQFLFEDEDSTVEQQVVLIQKELVDNPTKMIDHIDGVQTVEQFEYSFTVKDFLSQIGLI